MSIKRMCLKPQHLHHGSGHVGLEMCADEHQTYVFETATFASCSIGSIRMDKININEHQSNDTTMMRACHVAMAFLAVKTAKGLLIQQKGR